MVNKSTIQTKNKDRFVIAHLQRRMFNSYAVGNDLER
jgi:hypothetical protein